MKTFTLGLFIFWSSLFAGHLFGQDLAQKGLKIISTEEVSSAQLAQILAYDFESYRKSDQSVFIQVIGGPTLEVLAKGNSPKVISAPTTKNLGEHLQPNERDLPKVEIIQLNLFNVNE